MQHIHQIYYQDTKTKYDTIGGTTPEDIHARADERARLQNSKLPGPELVIEQ